MPPMAVRAVVFDIGGVLEIAPDLGVLAGWAARLGLATGELADKTEDIWTAGSVGTISEAQVHQALAERLDVPDTEVAEVMAALWQQYLGTPNTELIDYARSVRTRCRTGILSNSFVGAREREQAAYGLTDLVDVVIYSHEVGLAKPDPRVYELTCHQLGLAPEEVVFIDDIEDSVAAARSARLKAVHHQDNQQTIGAIGAIETILND